MKTTAKIIRTDSNPINTINKNKIVETATIDSRLNHGIPISFSNKKPSKVKTRQIAA